MMDCVEGEGGKEGERGGRRGRGREGERVGERERLIMLLALKMEGSSHKPRKADSLQKLTKQRKQAPKGRSPDNT